METIYLNQIKDDNRIEKLVYKWNYIEVNKTIRIYYWHDISLKFYVIEQCGWDVEVENFNPEHCHVDILYSGIVYFDGLRHFYMGDNQTDNYGYLHYPKLRDHIHIFEAINKLISEIIGEIEDD